MRKQVTKTAKTETKTVAAPLRAKKAASVAIAAPAPVATAEPLSKRVTPNTKIEEWRVVPSQRRGQPGWFLQGGNYQMHQNGRNAFTVGAELYFELRQEAQAALKERRQAAA